MMKAPCLSLFLLISANLLAQSDYFWVGGSGNWSDLSHWATTSGGSTFHTEAPTSADDVYFNANSFSSASQVVTLDIEANCNSMDWTAVANFPSINGNGKIINIYGSLVLSPDMTADFRFVEFESTSAGNTITSNGTSLGSNSITRLNGIGGAWTLQDNFTTNNISVIAGTFNTNNNVINSGDFFQTSGSSTKAINLGSSDITTERWWITGTNQTINAGTSKIIVSSFKGDSQGDGPFNYYDVEFYNYGVLENTSSFNEITVPAGLDLNIRSGDVFTVNNLVATGTKYLPALISSATEGSEATFSKPSGSITISYVELQDIHATGGATFTANDAVDNGNNTGWIINAPTGMDYYWVGNGGDWSDYTNHWATVSGGGTMHTDYPGKHDDVFFDVNSFTTSAQTVTNDLAEGAQFHDMNWTAVTNSPTLTADYLYPLIASGSVTFVSGMNKSIHTIRFEGNGTGLSFTALGSGSNSYITFDGSGTYDLLSDITCSSINHYDGTVNYNNVTIDCSFDFSIGNFPTDPILNLGNATITCTDLKVNSGGTPTINMGTSSFIIERDLDIGGMALYDVTMGADGAVFGSNTFEHFTIEPGSAVTLEAGETQTVNQSITMDGTKASPINLSSDAGGTQATISMSSGTVDATYLVMKDIAATGGAIFNATQTIDNGNNTGWNITGIVGEDYYWVGDGGIWSDFVNHWVTTSGGSTFHISVPGVLDNVFFDANSFTVAGQVVTVDNSEANFSDLDASGVAQGFTLSGSGKEFNVYGSINLPSIVYNSVDTYNFLSTSSETLSFNGGPSTNVDFNFSSSGTWTLTSDLTLGTMTFESGTLNTNGYEVFANSSEFLGTDAKTLILGTSTIFAGSWLVYDFVENVTIDGGSSEMSVAGSFKVRADVNNITLNNLTYVNSPSSGDGLIYDNLTLNKFTIEAGKTIKPVIDVTITTNEFVAVGTALDPIIFEPQVGGASLTISQASGTVDAYYLEMSEVTATGGAIFNAFNSIDNGNVFGWIFDRANQTIDFTAIADKVYGDADFSLQATASSGLEVTFSIVSGPSTLSGNILSITGLGTVQVKAEQAGDIDYNPAPSVTLPFDVLRADQSIIFNALVNKTVGDLDFDLSASASSGLAVSYTSSDVSVATISGNTVTIVGAGTTTITASQSGNANYNAAVDVVQDLIVSAPVQSQSITFASIGTQFLEVGEYTLSATASSGLEVSFEVVSGPATLSGKIISFTGTGEIVVTAVQLGNQIFAPAIPVEQTIEVITVTAVQSDNPLSHINYYPNPFASSLYVEILNGQLELDRIAIINPAGQVVRNIDQYGMGTSFRLDVNDLPSGMYILLISVDGVVKKHMILKN